MANPCEKRRVAFHLPRVVALPADGDVGHLRSTSVLRERKEQLLAGNRRAVEAGIGQQAGHGIAHLLIEVGLPLVDRDAVQRVQRNEIHDQRDG